MKKIHLIVLAMVFLGLDVCAQDSGFSARAGLNFSNTTAENSRVGFHMGGLYSMQIMSKVPVFFEPGLMLQFKGGKLDTGYGTFKTNVVYLEIPATFSCRCEINKDLALQPSFGPFFALGISGKYKNSNDGGSTSEDLFGDDGYAKRGDMGFKFAVGALIRSSYYVGLGYDISFVNIAKEKMEDLTGSLKVRNGSFNISAGYYF